MWTFKLVRIVFTVTLHFYVCLHVSVNHSTYFFFPQAKYKQLWLKSFGHWFIYANKLQEDWISIARRLLLNIKNETLFVIKHSAYPVWLCVLSFIQT